MKITRLEVVRVGVNHRGDWLFVRLRTDEGLVGIGEASHGGGVGRDAVVTAILTSNLSTRSRKPMATAATIAKSCLVLKGEYQ